MVAVGLIKSCYFLADSYWVGKLGERPLAAIGGAAFAWWMIYLACDLPAVGTQALVARNEGAGNRSRSTVTLGQGLWGTLAVAAFLAAVCFPVRGAYFDLLGFAQGSEELKLGLDYLGPCLLGAVTLGTHSVLGAVFQGIGDTRTALGIAAITLLVNAGLDPLLIWGSGPLPGLGIAGAAWATVVSNALGAVLGVALLARRGIPVRFALPSARILRLIGRIGGPVTASGIGFSMVYVLLGRFINDFGTEHMAGLGVGHRLESIGYLLSVGFSVGAATMVGQNLGAGRVEGASRSAHSAALLCSATMLPIVAGLYLFAEPLMGAFTDDPETVAAGVLYLRIQTTVMLFMGLEVVYEGAFSGAGNTMPAFWITAIFTSIRIPLAWWFAIPLGMGPAGIWWAINLTTCYKAALLRLVVRKDAWLASAR